MSEVQPIKDKRKLQKMAKELKSMDDKYYIMFFLGTYTGLRVSDVLKLKVSDIDNMSARKITEQKTDKKRFLYLNSDSEKVVRDYIKKNHLEPDDYLIPSRKHGEDGSNKPISRVQAYRVLNDAAEAVKLDAIGTHTMRKTFGYHYYQKTHDVTKLMRIFNHSSQAVTLRYIGIEDDEIRESLDDFDLGF